MSEEMYVLVTRVEVNGAERVHVYGIHETKAEADREKRAVLRHDLARVGREATPLRVSVHKVLNAVAATP